MCRVYLHFSGKEGYSSPVFEGSVSGPDGKVRGDHGHRSEDRLTLREGFGASLSCLGFSLLSGKKGPTEVVRINVKWVRTGAVPGSGEVGLQ